MLFRLGVKLPERGTTLEDSVAPLPEAGFRERVEYEIERRLNSGSVEERRRNMRIGAAKCSPIHRRAEAASSAGRSPLAQVCRRLMGAYRRRHGSYGRGYGHASRIRHA